MANKGTLLVTGASGHLGQLVLESLLKKSKNKIIATSRDAGKLKAFADRGVETRSADFNDPSSLVQAFTGAERLLIISTDAIGNRVEQHKNAIDAAVKAGVKHLVYTSWINPDRSPSLVAPDHVETEKLIEQSGLTYTILRNSLYTDNLLSALPHAIQSGTLAGAQGGGRQSYVTREDCAHAAAGALLSDEVINAIYDITGPRAVSYPELATILSEISGKEIKSVDLPASDYKGALVGSGLPEFVADLLLSFDLSVKQGSVAGVTTAVRDLSGQAPEDIKDFLIAHKKSFLS
jgi:NAD(P)H dehydrogenase (quinone)